MIDIEMVNVEVRDLPAQINVYALLEDGTVCDAVSQHVDVFINEFEVEKLYDPEVSKHIRTNYGRFVGVMRDVPCLIQSGKYTTSKMLLGIVKGPEDTKSK